MSNYDVGYKRPPAEHRFRNGNDAGRNGRRGNKPRAKVDNSAAGILRRLDAETVVVKGRKISKLELELRILQARALAGDMKALALLDRRRQMIPDTPSDRGGGVLLLPWPGPLHEWEASAAIQQAKFRSEDPEGLAQLYSGSELKP